MQREGDASPLQFLVGGSKLLIALFKAAFFGGNPLVFTLVFVLDEVIVSLMIFFQRLYFLSMNTLLPKNLFLLGTNCLTVSTLQIRHRLLGQTPRTGNCGLTNQLNQRK